ncbi:hypothetical protein ACRRTK_020120 [Alexandromys fortis]
MWLHGCYVPVFHASLILAEHPPPTHTHTYTHPGPFFCLPFSSSGPLLRFTVYMS